MFLLDSSFIIGLHADTLSFELLYSAAPKHVSLTCARLPVVADAVDYVMRDFGIL